jgi:phosphoglycerol transferase MdoB-like AlkP superfamily enzyme
VGTGLLAGLTLFFSMRYPDRRFHREFYGTLALLALTALSAIPLFRDERPGKLVFAPLLLFVASLLSFLLFVGRTTVARVRDERERRQRRM